MHKTIVLLISSALFSLQLAAAEGVISVKSRFKVAHTADRFKGVAEKQGMHVFKHIYHSENAKSEGKTIRPTELIIFGNPKIGSALMACNPTIGLDLPQKLLVWQDKQEQTWMSYNNPVYIADRHGLNKECRENLHKIAIVLEKLTSIAGDTQ